MLFTMTTVELFWANSRKTIICMRLNVIIKECQLKEEVTILVMLFVWVHWCLESAAQKCDRDNHTATQMSPKQKKQTSYIRNILTKPLAKVWDWFLELFYHMSQGNKTKLPLIRRNIYHDPHNTVCCFWCVVVGGSRIMHIFSFVRRDQISKSSNHQRTIIIL